MLKSGTAQTGFIKERQQSKHPKALSFNNISKYPISNSRSFDSYNVLTRIYNSIKNSSNFNERCCKIQLFDCSYFYSRFQ